MPPAPVGGAFFCYYGRVKTKGIISVADSPSSFASATIKGTPVTYGVAGVF